jgi:hypothetical protein
MIGKRRECRDSEFAIQVLVQEVNYTVAFGTNGRIFQQEGPQ